MNGGTAHLGLSFVFWDARASIAYGISPDSIDFRTEHQSEIKAHLTKNNSQNGETGADFISDLGSRCK